VRKTTIEVNCFGCLFIVAFCALAFIGAMTLAGWWS